MDSTFTIDMARPDEWATAFGLVFGHLSPEDRDARVARALTLVQAGELNAGGIVVARTAGGVGGAMVAFLLRGAGGLVWPPRALAGHAGPIVEDNLVQAACAWLQGGGAKLAQAILAPEEAHLASPLERNGFAHITQLQYLRHALNGPSQSADERLVFASYAATSPQLFQRTLLRTYEGTLDCPELNDVRSFDEIIDGHKAQGAFDPGRWWLALQAGEPVGVLLLTQALDMPGWDLSYVGVVAEKRRRGFGRSLVQKALSEAQLAGVPQLTLAVDVRNDFAWRMYENLGFQASAAREIYLIVFARTAPCR